MDEKLCIESEFEEKYLLSICLNFNESVDFIFDCDSIKWIPIKLVQ